MSQEDKLFLLIIALTILAFIGSAQGTNLTQGSCLTYNDSNGTTTQFCSPPILNNIIQFHPADYGVVSFLNYTCLSGEIVNNSIPIYINITTNVTNSTICYNATNNTTAYKLFNVDRVMTYDERFSDFDARLILTAPPYPRINENKLMQGGETANWNLYGLVVSCLNSTPIQCPPIPTPEIRYVNNTEIVTVTATPPAVQSSGTDIIQFLIQLLVLGGIGYLAFIQFKNQKPKMSAGKSEEPEVDLYGKKG
jgi:hypothetical protein